MIVPGFYYDMTADQYHADPCPEPSLSSGIIRKIIEKSMRHAWRAHPRLGQPAEEPEQPTRQQQIGTAAHKLILGRGREICRIEADDYRKAEAKAAREHAIQGGLAPILASDHDIAKEIASSFFEQIGQIDDCEGFAAAPAEVVAIAQDANGIWLRAMLDKFEDRGSNAIIWDVKTTGIAAAPQGIGRVIASNGYEIQAGHYERVVGTLASHLIGRITFRWAFIETEPPHLVTVAEIDAAGLEIGRRKASAACTLFKRSLETNIWPGYASRIVKAEYPPYAESAWLAREENDMRAAYDGQDPFLNLTVWEPPRPKTDMLTEIVP